MTSRSAVAEVGANILNCLLVANLRATLEANLSAPTITDRVDRMGYRLKPQSQEKHRKPIVLFLMLALALIPALSRFASAEQTPWMHVPENSFDQGWGLLDLSRLWDTERWQEQRSLTGSWGGTREQLYKYGIAVLVSYEGGSATNPVGGELHKVRYCDTFGVALFLDLERLFNFKDTFLLASAAQRQGHSLSADIPNFYNGRAVGLSASGSRRRMERPRRTAAGPGGFVPPGTSS